MALDPSYSIKTPQQIYAEELADNQILLGNVNLAIQEVAAGAQSYSLDTGTNMEKVTKATLSELTTLKKYLLSEIVRLDGLINGGGGMTARPGW